MGNKEKYQFLFSNLLKGLGWLTILLLLFIYFKDSVVFQSDSGLMKYGNSPNTVFFIYTISEIIVGMIPPELFMMWSLELAEYRNYVADLALLSVISYAAGTLSYLFGRFFNGTVLYRYTRKKYLRKYEEKFNEYGGFLLFVAAVTPIPYSAICMLVGSVKYPFRNFFLISLFRILRFVVYGYLVYEASLI
jgi:membrane protein YqaA with SNARE-associated domain